MAKLNVKKGDPVIVISGKDKGKAGKITQIDKANKRVALEGDKIDQNIKHVKPRSAQQKGGRINQPKFIDASNVMVVCNSCGSPTRVNKKIVKENGKEEKIRICKKCGASLEIAPAKSKSAAKKAIKKKTAKAESKKVKPDTKVEVKKEIITESVSENKIEEVKNNTPTESEIKTNTDKIESENKE